MSDGTAGCRNRNICLNQVGSQKTASESDGSTRSTTDKSQLERIFNSLEMYEYELPRYFRKSGSGAAVESRSTWNNTLVSSIERRSNWQKYDTSINHEHAENTEFKRIHKVLPLMQYVQSTSEFQYQSFLMAPYLWSTKSRT